VTLSRRCVTHTGFWATVCKTVRPILYRTVVCLSCPVPSVLYVTLAYCDQTVGLIKIPLGTEIGLSPGDIVLDGDWTQLPPMERGTAPPHFSAHIYCGQTVAHLSYCWALVTTICSSVLFCSLAFLDPRVGHTMDVLSPFISILCHSD